jgi:hypothetical protein
MDPIPYKSDPMFGCNTSLENESFFERFRCALIQPLQVAYAMGPFARQLDNVRKQMNIKTTSGKVPKVSLALIDTFFGFEVIYFIINNLILACLNYCSQNNDLFFLKLPQPLAPNVQVITVFYIYTGKKFN